MTETNALSATMRDRAGKGAARAARRAGHVPAVIYGDKQEPVLINLNPKELGKQLHRPGFFAKLLNLTIDGKAHLTLPRDVQFDPVTDVPVHADFMRVGPKTRITVGVPVVFLNPDKAPGIKRGGILNIVRHEIELICQADNIPERIEVNLESIDVGVSIHISSVALPAGARPTITDRDFTIASIAAPTVMREEQAAAAAAAAGGPAAAAAAPAAAAAAAPAKAGAAPAKAGAAPAKAAPAKAGGKG